MMPVTSIRVTLPLHGVPTASKHAVEGLGKSLRQELAPWNIHVCHINPGFMK
jgi:NAD(P)-dependent dehydrogenase (short-subunit alcohol dehydrogenase family)